MVNIERIWRVVSASGKRFEVRLSEGPGGRPQVSLNGGDGGDAKESDGSFDIDVARAVAQAMLEACEVASALGEQTIRIR
jgi:hypothetical protein